MVEKQNNFNMLLVVMVAIVALIVIVIDSDFKIRYSAVDGKSGNIAGQLGRLSLPTVPTETCTIGTVVDFLLANPGKSSQKLDNQLNSMGCSKTIRELPLITNEDCDFHGDLDLVGLGDMNLDGTWNVLDIVSLANCVLTQTCGGCSSLALWYAPDEFIILKEDSSVGGNLHSCDTICTGEGYTTCDFGVYVYEEYQPFPEDNPLSCLANPTELISQTINKTDCSTMWEIDIDANPICGVDNEYWYLACLCE